MALDEDGWIQGNELPWTSPAMGIFTTAPVSAPDMGYTYTTYPDCVEHLCMVPSTWYLNDTSNAKVCPSVEHLAVYAACVGTLCPDDTANAHSTVQSTCKNPNNGGFDIPLSFGEWVEASRIDPVDAYNALLVHLASATTGSVPTTSRSTLPGSQKTATPTGNRDTTTETSTPTGSSETSGNSLSRSDSISIGVGLGIGIPTIILASLGVWFQRKRRVTATTPTEGPT